MISTINIFGNWRIIWIFLNIDRVSPRLQLVHIKKILIESLLLFTLNLWDSFSVLRVTVLDIVDEGSTAKLIHMLYALFYLLFLLWSPGGDYVFVECAPQFFRVQAHVHLILVLSVCGVKHVNTHMSWVQIVFILVFSFAILPLDHVATSVSVLHKLSLCQNWQVFVSL